MEEAKWSRFPQPSLLAPSSTAAPAPAGAASTAPSTSSGLPERLMHKNRLQEYTQRSGIPLPMYQTINEGSQHAPQFRSTVQVDGVSYVSPNTFSHRKAAEQDVAKCALEGISQKIKDEGCPLIREDTVFCKSILNEFAVKMDLEKPTYSTIQPEGLLPIFVSSLTFNGVNYTGEAGRNKKEAEQLAARTVILSLLGNSGSGTLLSEIIKSKRKLYAALHKVKDTSFAHTSAVSQGASVGQISAMPQGASVGQISAMPHGATVGQISAMPHGASLGQISAMPQEASVEQIIAMPHGASSVQSRVRPGVSFVQISASPRGVSTGQIPNVLDKAKEAEVAVCVKNVSEGSIPRASSVMTPYNHELKAPKLEEPSSPLNQELEAQKLAQPSCPFNQELKAPKLEPSSPTITEPSSQATDLPIAFVPPVLQQPQDERPTTKKRRKNRKKPNKKFRSDPQLRVAALPMTRTPPCPVAQ